MVITTKEDFKDYFESLETEPSLKERLACEKSFTRLIKNNIPYIHNIEHLASIIGISPKKIRFFMQNKDKAYISFKIPKKSGQLRIINAPSKELKFIQRWILDNVLYKKDTGEFAHGFVPGRSIYTNALNHVDNQLVLGIDIKNFFPNINKQQAENIFWEIGFNRFLARDLSEIVSYQNSLPQGAPTSPMIANLVSLNLDNKLGEYCLKKGFTYTRYADDITISGSKILAKYKNSIIHLVSQNGFRVNKDKVRIFGRGYCQKVTGLVVNDKVSIGKKKKRVLRAIMHNLITRGPIEANIENDPFFKERIFGQLSFTNMVEPEFAIPLINMYKSVDWTEYNLLYSTDRNGELFRRSILKSTSRPPIHFTDLEIFSDIPEISNNDYIQIKEQLDSLKEVCRNNVNKEECIDCIYESKDRYLNCMKYILGYFIGNVCGHHHGHEVCDLFVDTRYDHRDVQVCFHLKRGIMNKNGKNSLLQQFLHSILQENVDIASIVNNRTQIIEMNYDNYYRHIMKNTSKEWCLILRKEMARILFAFYNNKFGEKKTVKSLSE